MAGSEDFNAAEVARKEFATGFRGFDQYEVRAYLAKLAAEMGVLQERERGLRERLTEIERKRPSERVLADEEIETALGVEATKVIHAAREAGSEIRARAEENVARMLREAQAEAQAMRTEASGLLATRTEEADAAAAKILEAAQQRGREMVGEAQSVRERMLRDLSRRRRHAEAQIQLLLGGRERVVEALEQAVQAASATTEQLQAVELSDLPPLEPATEQDAAPGPESETTAAPAAGAGAPATVAEPATAPVPEQADGPVRPVRRMVAVENEPDSPPSGPDTGPGAPSGSTARPGDERRAGSLRLLRRRGEAQAPALDDDVEGVRIIRPEPELAGAVIEAEGPTAAESVTDGAASSLEAGDEPSEAEPASAEYAVEAETEVAAAEAGASDAVPPVAEDVAAEGAAAPDAAPGGDAETSDAPTPVIELFARMRADRAAAQAEPAPSPPVEPHEADDAEPAAAVEPEAPAEGAADDPGAVDAVFEARDAALEDAERALARSLKRALSDEQNEVLDSLRRLKGTPRIEVLLPEPAIHVARYQRVAAGPLATAATVGAASVESPSKVDVSSVAREVSVDELAHSFADEVAGDLRSRLERVLDAGTSDAEGLVDAISAGYREWKSARTDGAARHHTASAYSAAVYAASPEGALRWVVDPAEGGCPDCDDNALAGPTAKGTAYPTGQLHPPAHVGCRCLLRPLA